MRSLVLVSQSPRRKQLLTNHGYSFHSLLVKVSEFLDKNLNLDEALMAVARSKSEAALDKVKQLKLKNILLLSADTVVLYQGRVLGKPESEDQAKDYLRLLSGNTHTVKTSYCFWDIDTGKVVTGVDSSHVRFRKLSEEEIAIYVASGEPMDKAGSYGIQGQAKNFIESVDGDWDNVMGLPMNTVERILQENDWHIDKK